MTYNFGCTPYRGTAPYRHYRQGKGSSSGLLVAGVLLAAFLATSKSSGNKPAKENGPDANTQTNASTQTGGAQTVDTNTPVSETHNNLYFEHNVISDDNVLLIPNQEIIPDGEVSGRYTWEAPPPPPPPPPQKIAANEHAAIFHDPYGFGPDFARASNLDMNAFLAPGFKSEDWISNNQYNFQFHQEGIFTLLKDGTGEDGLIVNGMFREVPAETRKNNGNKVTALRGAIVKLPDSDKNILLESVKAPGTDHYQYVKVRVLNEDGSEDVDLSTRLAQGTEIESLSDGWTIKTTKGSDGLTGVKIKAGEYTLNYLPEESRFAVSSGDEGVNADGILPTGLLGELFDDDADEARERNVEQLGATYKVRGGTLQQLMNLTPEAWLQTLSNAATSGN